MQILLNVAPMQQLEEYVVLDKGKRGRIHPKLSAIEHCDCHIVYNTLSKFFVVDYKLENGKYSKSVITSQIDFLLDILLDA
jgi:hypothetical protein